MLILLISCITSKNNAPTEDTAVNTAEIICEGSEPMFNSSTGCIQGIHHEDITYYLGIPYAQPPVGDLRWQRTVPVNRWDEIFIANSLSDFCTQFDSTGQITGSEDCLTLNIFHPQNMPDEPLPILFFTNTCTVYINLKSIYYIQHYD